MGLRRSAAGSGSDPLPSGFDRTARAYRWLEYLTFGRALERCRCFYLGAIVQGARHALILGDGDGRFSARLLSSQPALRAVAVDSSAAMLGLLSVRVREIGAADRLQTVHSEALLFCEDEPFARGIRAEDASFDLFVSHFFLDCLSTVEVQRLADLLRLRAAPGARWIVSEFGTPAPWARLVVALLYWGFGMLAGLKTKQLPLWQAALGSAGWEPVTETPLLRGLLVTSVWQVATAPTHPSAEGNHATHLPVPPA